MVWLAGAIGAVQLAVRGATISGSWVHSVTRQCDRRGASGFVGDLVRAGSRTMARQSRRWCNDLSTLSVSLFARGPEMARRSRWSVTGFDEGGFERLERCDRLAPMRSSCSDVSDLLALSLSLSLSLSLFYFPRPEIIWSENENGNRFPLFWL